MKRLREKLKSRDGASLILSLLVFLVCVLVALSVLAAAVSNAGKVRSRRVEQQRYQTLSSAMCLISSELEKVKYEGKYTVYKWTDGPEHFYCKQEKSGGIVMQDPYSGQTFRLADFDFLQEGALNKEMDEIFRRQFLKDDGSGAKVGYGPLAEGNVTSSAVPVHLTVTLPEALSEYPYEAGGMPEEYKIPRKAHIKIELDHSSGNSAGNIKLTAWLDDGDASEPPSNGNGVMVAVLKPTWEPEILDSESGLGGGPSIPEGASSTLKSVSVTWKLDRVSMMTAP